MKSKYKCLVSFFALLIACFPSVSYGLNADDTPVPFNYLNNYEGLYNEVKDGVVMISNITSSGVSSGTGMVYKEDNDYLYIISNNHVVEGTTTLYVYFNNEERKEANILGQDEHMDIAVIYCEKPSKYKVLTYANSKYTKVGEEIMAIGNPVSSTMEYTVTKGIIANLDVEVSYGDFYKDKHVTMIDIALNPGNSGGPSFNVYGQVVGVNSLKYTYDGIDYYEGVNFMIPISDALNVANRIEHHKDHIFVRPYFGNGKFYDIEEFTLYQREAYSIPRNINDGVYIYTLEEENNSLLNAGVTKNSIIVSFANQTIKNKVQLRRVLYSLNIYQKVEIQYIDLNDNGTLKTSYVPINAFVFAKGG